MNGFIPRARYNPENTHFPYIAMPFKLGKVEKRLLTCGGLLLAGTCGAPVLASVGISAAAIPLISSMITGVTGGLVATDIGNITDSLGKNQGILINHDLTKAVGRAIGALILAMAREPQYQTQKKALKKLAQAAADNWKIVITSEAEDSKQRLTSTAEEPTNRYGNLTENQLPQIILNPENPALKSEEWEYLLQDWLEELAQVKLDPTTRQILAIRLEEGFSIALRETLADDFETGGKAFAKLTISLFRELHCILSQQNQQMSQQLQQSGETQSKLDAVLTRLEQLGQLQPGNPETQREFQALGKGIANVLVEVREIKENTVAIQGAIGELRQLDQQQLELLQQIYEQTKEPRPRAAQEKPQVVGLEILPPVPIWVGRETVMEQLESILTGENSIKVIAIIGQGGIGKSSLAAKLLEAVGVNLAGAKLRETCPYDGVLCLKTLSGTSFDEGAEFLLEALGIVAATAQAEGKIRKIIGRLARGRYLLVLDNLEDILHPSHHPQAGYATSPEWGKLLNALVYGNHRSQTLITSRQLPGDLADGRDVETRNFATLPDTTLVHRETLDGVSVEAGVELLRQKQLRDSEADLRWVVERVGGHAFILTQLGNFAKDKPGYLRQHPELVVQSAEPILKAQFARINKKARDLLRRMCVLRVGINLRGLTFLRLYADGLQKDVRFVWAEWRKQPFPELTQGDTEKTEKIVNRLVESSLVECKYGEERRETLYSLHRLVIEFLQTQHQQDLPRLLQLVYQFYQSEKPVENPQTLEDLRPPLEAQYFAFMLGNYSQAFSLLNKNVHEYLYPWGYWNLLQELYEQLISYITDDTELRICLQVIGMIHRETGNWEEAEKYFRKSLANAQKVKSKSGMATSWGLLGDIQRKRGNWNEAKRLYRQSLELRTELGDRSGMTATWASLGDIERVRGNWDEAEGLYQQSLELRTELGDHVGMATSWGVLGDIEKLRGNWDEAERLYRQCLAIETKLGDRFGMATSWGVLGDIEKLRGNWDEAECLYQKKLDTCQELGDKSGMSQVIGTLGDIGKLRGNWDEAERLYRQCLAIQTELGDRSNMAATWASLGDIEKLRGNWDEAERLYRQCLAIQTELGD
ncbi:tetratricopeptide repeat protein, partial [Laspinema sp. D1]|uniref:tetratricopeptide repeat protein n=1 Tax=Laspinema palackyanum TaxID=3231601 RepID=UPI003472A742|nr:tetratricopeptide repeat protein [Laspinema sp. D2b]